MRTEGRDISMGERGGGLEDCRTGWETEGFKGSMGATLVFLCGSFRAGALERVRAVIFTEHPGAWPDLLAWQISILLAFDIVSPQREKRTSLMLVGERILGLCLRLPVPSKVPSPWQDMGGWSLLISCLIESNGILGTVLDLTKFRKKEKLVWMDASQVIRWKCYPCHGLWILQSVLSRL